MNEQNIWRLIVTIDLCLSKDSTWTSTGRSFYKFNLLRRLGLNEEGGGGEEDNGIEERREEECLPEEKGYSSLH